MSIVSALLGGSYIELVKKYIDKIFIHEGRLFNHRDNEFDIILRKVDGNMRIFIYSRKEGILLRELSDKEAEKILTS